MPTRTPNRVHQLAQSDWVKIVAALGSLIGMILAPLGVAYLNWNTTTLLAVKQDVADLKGQITYGVQRQMAEQDSKTADLKDRVRALESRAFP